MRLSIVAAALAAPSALAFPWMSPEGMEALMSHPEARAEIQRRLEQGLELEKRQEGLPGIIPGLVTLLEGTLKAVLDPVLGLIPTDDSVLGHKKFPEASHPFREPGPTDQRGPCPGLNTLANHGYIPRTGIATLGQLVEGTNALFNMAPDLSLLLGTTGVVTGGDILSQKLSIGGPDGRVGLLNGALNPIFGTPSGVARHGTFNEGDASATREDFYLNNGDNIAFVPEYFKQMHRQAIEKGDGTYAPAAMREHFKNRYAASRARNSQFYFMVPSAFGVMGAYYFVPGFLSNGTIGLGGVANQASINSFYGAKPKTQNHWNNPDAEYEKVPERIPEQGWYRRATPMTVAEAAAGILDIYTYAKPAIGGAGADEAFIVGPALLPNNPQALSCFIYNSLYGNLPGELFNLVDLARGIVNTISSKIAPGYKALGCEFNFPDAPGQGASYREAYIEWRNANFGNTDLMVGGPWYKNSTA